MMFALALVPLLGMAGAGVEYSRMLATQSRLQNTVDSAALGLVGEASNLTASALLARAKQLVLSGLQGTEAANSVAVNANYNSSTSTVSVTASASLDATLMRVFGYSNLPVAASSKASKSIGTLELALVLDNTGSMQTNGKISALKKASHDLLTSVQSAATSVNAIKVSIVPFDTHVNLGTAVGTQPWMDWSYYSSTDLYGTGADNFDATVIGCTSGNTNATGGANSSESNTQQTGNNTGGNTVLADNGSGKCKPKIVSTAPASWTGCVIDRDMPYDVQNTAPTTDPATWYPGMDCNLATLLPLTTRLRTH